MEKELYPLAYISPLDRVDLKKAPSSLQIIKVLIALN